MFADVIVNLSIENVDKTYQYHIPEQWAKQAVVGAPVRVAFGFGGRTMEGYIVGLSDEPKIERSKIKPILEVLEKGLVVESQLLLLAHWMKVNYGTTMNEALRTVVPVKSKVQGKTKKFVVRKAPLDEVRKWLDENGTNKNYRARTRLLRELCVEPVIAMELVAGKLCITRESLKGMVEMGMIEIQSETQYRNPIPQGAVKGDAIPLNKGQQRIVNEITGQYREGKRGTYLIHGVTGSGKTEVYMEIISEVIRSNRQVIFLIPEIALTYQTVMRFYRRFGDRVSILNSRMSAGERYDQYVRAKEGSVDVMIGPRSALFTPFARLGLIVMDEEHEASYKSDSPPKYHAREAALERARLADASLVLGSATPSLEAYQAALEGDVQLLSLTERAGEGTVPKVHVVDMREELKRRNRTIFSIALRERMVDRLEKGQQIMLFINRRGYASFVSCRNCGEVMTCPHCDISLKTHGSKKANANRLLCHYCGFEKEMPPVCPNCGSKYIGAFGTGTQKIEELVKMEFPQARVLRMDLDTTSNKYGHQRILEAFANHEADVLVGTQMIVKGHDFPLVTLMGVLAADMSLFVNDYRAAERTFQLLMQAAGRAGRGGEPGDVVIQTYQPEHFSIRAVASHDYEAFYRHEMAYRKLLQYPPISDIMAVLVTSKEEEDAKWTVNGLHQLLTKGFAGEAVKVIGPAAASIARIKDQYRKVLYVKGERKALIRIRDGMEAWVREEGRKGCLVYFDRNPLHGY